MTESMQLHQAALTTLDCSVRKYKEYFSHDPDPPFRRVLRRTIVSLIELLSYYQGDEREEIIRSVAPIRAMVLTGGFEDSIVDALSFLAREPTSDPSEELVRKVSTLPPPPSLPEEEL